MDEVFWQAVAALVAGTVACSTALAWFFGNLARNRSRAEADWAYNVYAHIITPNTHNDHGVDGDIAVNGTFANAGDANAFRLTMTVSSGKGGLTTPSGSQFGGANAHNWLAVTEPGSSVNFWCEVPADDWEDFVIYLDWVTTPTRLKKHLQFELRPSEEIPHPERIKAYGEV